MLIGCICSVLVLWSSMEALWFDLYVMVSICWFLVVCKVKELYWLVGRSRSNGVPLSQVFVLLYSRLGKEMVKQFLRCMSSGRWVSNLTLRNNCILWLMCSPLFCVVSVRNFLARILIKLCRIDMSPPLSEFKTPSVWHLREDTIYKLMMILLDVVVRVPFLEKKLSVWDDFTMGPFR